MFEAVRAAAISTPIRRPADTGRCIWLNHLDLGGRGRLESRRRPYRMTIMKTQPQSPLFPLLPSVQILFAAFCRALFEAVRGGAAISTPIRRPADTGRCIWLNHFGPRRTTASTRTIAESPKALPDDHHRNSTPSPFVSFAAFCSNFLLFLML